MTSNLKTWLIIGTILIVIGLIVLFSILIICNWDITKLSTNNYESNTHEISEEFSDIRIDTNSANIRFVLSNDESCKIECFEDVKAKHSVTVQDGALDIKVVNNKAWYDYIGINLKSPEITIHLPKTEYTALFIKGSTGSVDLPNDFTFTSIDIDLSTGFVKCFCSASESIKVNTSTGKIHVEKVNSKAFNLSTNTGICTMTDINCDGDIRVAVTTGKTVLTNIKCTSLLSDGSTGNISLNNVIASDNLDITRSTGNVIFNGSDANEIHIKTDTGNVKGSILTEKIFHAHSDTGKIEVPKTAGGGKCEVYTDTGNVILEIK